MRRSFTHHMHPEVIKIFVRSSEIFVRCGRARGYQSIIAVVMMISLRYKRPEMTIFFICLRRTLPGVNVEKVKIVKDNGIFDDIWWRTFGYINNISRIKIWYRVILSNDPDSVALPNMVVGPAILLLMCFDNQCCQANWRSYVIFWVTNWCGLREIWRYEVRVINNLSIVPSSREYNSGTRNVLQY